MPSRIRWTVFSISCSIVAGRSTKTMMSGCCMVLCRPIEYAQPGVDRFSWTTFSMCRPSASTSARICCSMFEGFIAGAILMEVMTLDIVQSLQRPEALGTHGGLSFAVLDDPFDDQSGVAEDRGAPFGEKLRGHDSVREAGIVFEREEDEALRRAGTLADDHLARGRHTAAIRDEFQIGGGQDVVALELRAEVLEQMRTDSDLGGLVVGQRFFERGHFGQRVPRHPERSRGTWVGGRRAILPPRSLDYARDDALFEQLARVACRARSLPHRFAARVAERRKCARIRELRQLIVAQAAAARELVGRRERLPCFDRLTGRRAQSPHVAQSHPHAAMLPAAHPS